MIDLFEDKKQMSKWEFEDHIIYVFEKKCHMHEFMLYRDYDGFGLNNLFFTPRYEVKIMKKNIKFRF